jgi:prepilin-type N-terminal cleavage/methylation domain-containing protein
VIVSVAAGCGSPGFAFVGGKPGLPPPAMKEPVMKDRQAMCKKTGFTLIEMLVTVAIITVLFALSLAGIMVARKHASVIRTKDDLHLIELALEAYKSELGTYPVFADPTTDQASTTVAGNGNWLDYADCRGAVLLCRAMIGSGPANSTPNISASYYYASPGDDGADGPGFRTRRIYNATTGQFSGKVYGPYIDPSKFKIGYLTPSNCQLTSSNSTAPMEFPVILDSNGNPILYYPALPSVTGTATSGSTSTKLIDSVSPTVVPPVELVRFNVFDNAAVPSPLSSATSSSQNSMSVADIQALAGNCSGYNYLLWTAGADGIFGYDHHGKCDDIANFDIAGQ